MSPGLALLREPVWRRAICRLMTAAILFAQVAVSAYACPYTFGTAEAAVNPAVAINSIDHAGAAADCETMTQPSPVMTLQCAEHCRYGQQADQMQTVTLPAAVLVCLYPAASSPASGVSMPSTSVDAAVAHSPPHAILHCCLRI